MNILNLELLFSRVLFFQTFLLMICVLIKFPFEVHRSRIKSKEKSCFFLTIWVLNQISFWDAQKAESKASKSYVFPANLSTYKIPFRGAQKTESKSKQSHVFPADFGTSGNSFWGAQKAESKANKNIMYDPWFVYLQKFPLRCTESRIKSRKKSNVNRIHEQKLLMTGI